MTDIEKEKVEKSDRGINIVGSMRDRGKVWARKEMIEAIQWFIEGEEVAYNELVEKNNSSADNTKYTHSEKLSFVKDILRKAHIDVYVVDMTNPLAKHAGLKVVRAVSPDLIPMFFNENRRPLGVSRFTHDSNGNKATLNPVPHPFI